MKLITNCLVYDNKGRRKKFLTVLSRLAGKKLSDSMMEYFMAKDPVPGSAVPVHALHGLYDREIKEAPQYLEGIIQTFKRRQTAGLRDGIRLITADRLTGTGRNRDI